MGEGFWQWAERTVDRAVRGQVLSQRMSRAFFFSAYADAESSGEAQVFERCLRRATDPDVARMIRRHQQDELDHASWLEARREALGLPRIEIPPSLKLLDQLSAAAGGVLDLPMTEDAHVAEAYALLYVVEERAVAQFERTVPVLRAVGDDESADLFARIALDEHRHLRYCRAVGRRYAGSEQAFETRVERMRPIEGRVFAEQSRATTRRMLDRGWLVLPAPWSGLLRATLWVSGGLKMPAPLHRIPATA